MGNPGLVGPGVRLGDKGVLLPAGVTPPLPTVEQVANVVLYSSDYYVKPVAMEETQ